MEIINAWYCTASVFCKASVFVYFFLFNESGSAFQNRWLDDERHIFISGNHNSM